jgi:murein tripeptide amidase MpaA
MRSHRRALVGVLAISFLLGTAVAPAAAQTQPPEPHGRLELYEATLDAAQWESVQGLGLDVANVEETVEGVRVQLVMYPQERNALRKLGIELQPVRNEEGLTQAEAAIQQSVHGFDVWRSFDEPGGIEDQLHAIASAPQNSGFVRLFDLGDSHQGRDIIAVRLTQGAGVPVGSRPAVLFQATTHAREWISTEVDMRLLRWFIEQNRANNPEVRKILQTTEVWFIPVVNPDGYQYTFDVDRLWRKNLRDNNGDGVIAPGDGVDLNRNYPEHWNYDEEGSSSPFASDTYRGPGPASEPETQADMALFDMLPNLRFAVSYHSFGELLLYTQGWQVQTPSADDPIYLALTGTDDDPAIDGFNPGVGADLYTTNGEFTDWAHGDRGVLAWTPELPEGCEGCGFVFPDDEALVEAEFKRNLDFALNIARSAVTPDDPVSHMDFETEDLYLDLTEIDPWKSGNPSSDLRVDVSYGGGSSQPVEVLARRSAGAVTLNYSINGGGTQLASTSETPAGEVFGGSSGNYDTYYSYLRGEVPGIAVGDSVEYWFTAGQSSSEHQTFQVVEDANADVLIVAQEDRTGASNVPGYASTDPGVPNYLSSYTDALDASGVSYDVFDVDAGGRQAPDHLGVLAHYDAVVWYTGNDFVTRQLGRGPGNIDRLANDLVLEARAYLNEAGKLLHTGQWAGAVPNGVAGNQYYDPVNDEACMVGGAPSPIFDRCALFSDKNDFLQYYLGAYIYNSDAGTDADGNPFPVVGVSDPYTGIGWEFNGADSAANQVHTASFITTSSLLPDDEYPQFASDAPAVWDTGASGAFEPFDGDWYMYSNMADVSYKRLMRTIDLTSVTAADSPTLTFRISYDTEPDWDFVFVEAHTVGADDWTTLPDANGHTDANTGESCPEGWFELHPWLERYQGSDCSGSNPSTGGEWNAHSGRSAGWEEWQIDLSAYAGSAIEISISYASDWSFQGLGAFVDQVAVSTEPGVESFEAGLGAWTVAGPPEGSAASANDWERSMSVGFEEGAVTSTVDTLYFGFGFEGITGADTRAAVMDKSMQYLLGP